MLPFSMRPKHTGIRTLSIHAAPASKCTHGRLTDSSLRIDKTTRASLSSVLIVVSQSSPARSVLLSAIRSYRLQLCVNKILNGACHAVFAVPVADEDIRHEIKNSRRGWRLLQPPPRMRFFPKNS